jgi:hypothetical protein
MNALPIEFPEQALLLGQKFICIDDDFSPAAQAHYPQLPQRGQSYTLAEIHWGKCHDGQFRLTGNFTELLPSQPDSGLFLHRFSPISYGAITLGEGCSILACSFPDYPAHRPTKRLLGQMLHPTLHQPINLYTYATHPI